MLRAAEYGHCVDIPESGHAGARSFARIVAHVCNAVVQTIAQWVLVWIENSAGHLKSFAFFFGTPFV